MVVMLVALCVSARAAQPTNAELPLKRESECLFFDGMMHAKKPDLRRYGIEPLHIVYESWIWNRSDPVDSLPDAAKLREQVKRAALARRMLVLDVERWAVDDRASDVQFAEHAARLLQIASDVRKYDSSVRVGYFGLFPDTYQRAALQDPSARLHRQWLQTNERASALAHGMDVTLPELYTYTESESNWVKSAKLHIAQARKYMKPVYVFLWPQYAATTANARKDTFIPVSFWTAQLQTACTYADGVVIWGGWDPDKSQPAEWSSAEPWWRATTEYLQGVRGTQPVATP